MKTENRLQSLRQTLNLLKYTFVIVPVAAGADTFTNLLTQRDQYLNPSLAAFLPVPVPVFMMVTGTIEIIAGLIVLFKTETVGYIVAAWLILIALTLLAGCRNPDVAVRGLVMAIAAFSLARVSHIVSQPWNQHNR
ncbi:MAG: hypothetical protein IT242_09665 [Bacteroidia bacterium]|nr:hypothetical protein [Bacteroidia bacterium]